MQVSWASSRRSTGVKPGSQRQRSRFRITRCMIETATEKSGLTAGEKSNHSGKERTCSWQATSTKRADDDDAGVRSRRRCPRQCLEVHQLQLIDKTIGIPASTQKQTAVHLTELRTIRWSRRNSYRPFRSSRRLSRYRSRSSCRHATQKYLTFARAEDCGAPTSPAHREYRRQRRQPVRCCARPCPHGPDSAEHR